MWSFVTIKDGEPVGEDVGKSVSLDTWGLAVKLKVTIAVSSPNEPGDLHNSMSKLGVF